MKPLGPIPSGYGANTEGRLLIGGHDVTALIEAAGDTPLFVYDLGMVARRVERLRAAMPAGLEIHYAVKANPFAPLVSAMAGIVDGFDVASDGELRRAIEAGMAAAHVSFAGPGKKARELEAAIRAGATINLESEHEADRALSIGEALGLTPRLAVRINPEFELRGSGMRMGGGAKPFGVDQERVAPLVRRLAEAGADYRGLHVFAGSQSLDGDAIIETQANSVALARQIDDRTGIRAPLVNLGGGFGIPYFAGDVALDVEAIGAALAGRIDGEAERYAIELGRWLVAEAGVYLARIVDRKVSHGKVFLVTDGGLHHQLAASGNFGTVVRRNYPVAVATKFGAEPGEEASVVGCLCTPLDRLADDAMLPRAEPGDIIAVFLAGAYGATASPTAFLGHPAPCEIAISAESAVILT
ncbi:pyridoxal-dependent decarboxylase, exosortase A system-associated [Sphingomonas sp. CGMCC 1.13654]|uniref:Pyridoxal-dependent decarboxylase, exosortase A system-associated n=1 Tax=Sphingomonas chungangi TaxID=2683589 RepID=A0A838LAW2_9SPHN|nr:pyridoxal-dependent decarboxylase, exosortase A system-associated [Sphingomonas chungangi]MBA2935845.1 pyridoxal-dependent decarboxylase, exosortase A system-associated [Sphingomonas chungangi]MVW54536.1 pyridoxal-dependent decarboxylase, exosortase A system-associated [Sphingomonas chungangi]